MLGADVAGSGAGFDLEVRIGAGAYVCGEETALLESLEGKRGIVRAKPPLPAHAGLFGKPTVINNVLTLAAVPFILAEGAKAYADFGMGRSRGTMPIQLAGNIKRGGLFETAFGVTLRRVGRRHRRRHRIGPADQGGAGRRAARRLLPARAVRHAVRLRGLRGTRRAHRPRRHRRVRRHRGHGASRRGSRSSSAPSRAAASARPAASARRAAPRRSTKVIAGEERDAEPRARRTTCATR